jgi:hypothetical protein
MKKEGLLGNAFLDEAEIEATLNEFGASGWELVSLMEVNDGLIAVFKQPFLKDIIPVCETIKEGESKQPLNTLTDMPMKKVPVSLPVTDSIGSDSQKDEDVGAIKIM